MAGKSQKVQTFLIYLLHNQKLLWKKQVGKEAQTSAYNLIIIWLWELQVQNSTDDQPHTFCF